MEKIVIIINGRGGVGKDTLCEFAAKNFRVQNISAITPIKKIASEYGWNGEKDAKSRKFLSDLKKAFIDYNDLPTMYLYYKYKEFLDSNDQILFMHVREIEEIDKIKKKIESKCITLLVNREISNNFEWGNYSDDQVDQYKYDFYYDNNKELDKSESDFITLLDTIINMSIIKNKSGG